MKKAIPTILALVLISTLALGCNSNDDESNDVFSNCCSDDPVFGVNVNNLDQSQGQIVVYNVITPNGDGINDVFGINNIELYENATVTIYDNNDVELFESSNYGQFSEVFPNAPMGENGAEGIPDGTYKYKIVIEDEQTFLRSGTFCVFTDINQPQNFSECSVANGFDPLLTGN